MKEKDAEFEIFRTQNIERLVDGQEQFMSFSKEWMRHSSAFNYTYNFKWLGVPIIQFPQDIVSLQELVFENKPDIIIETGVARGGSVLLSASLLALIDLRRSLANKTSFVQSGLVVGIDLEIRQHTYSAIESDGLSSYVRLIEGSSTSTSVEEAVSQIVTGYKNPMVLLDSNHTEDHVLAELNIYSKFIAEGGFIVVYDTSIEFDSDSYWKSKDRNWGPGNSPLSALRKFLIKNPDFELVIGQSEKLGITVCPSGIVRRKSI